MEFRNSIIGAAVLAAAAFLPHQVSAMPNGLPSVKTLSTTEQVRWVCNPWGRCWWRPGFHAGPRFYAGPRFGHRRWGWHRPHWRRW